MRQLNQYSKHIHILLYIVGLLILIYAIADFQSSANTVVKTGERTVVHATLLLILIYCSYLLKRKLTKKNKSAI